MKLVPTAVTRKFAKQVLATKANSPHIFFAAGVVGVVGSTILACRATLRLPEALDEAQAQLEKVRTDGAAAVSNPNIQYTEQDQAKDKTIVLVKTAVVVGKLYGPSIVLGGLSIAALTGSHVQLARRNTALASTLAVVTKAFEEYRVRVQDEIGEEKEKDLFRGLRTETHMIDGKKTEVKVRSSEGGLSPYAQCFDAKSPYWLKSREANLFYLTNQQNWANERLQAQGFLFLNDIYDSLGFEKTRAGQIVGWMRRTDGGVDGYIDFGIHEAHAQAFLSGHDPSIWLDFNVDGPILDKALGKH